MKKIHPDPSPKKRKTTQGPIKDKARTIQKLLDAVSAIVKREGYRALTVTNIAKESELSKKIMYDYFGSLDNLIEAYILSKDFWKTEATPEIHHLLAEGSSSEALMAALFQHQFKTLMQDNELLNIMLWGISEPNDLMLKISNDREAVGEQVFTRVEPEFKDAPFDLRGIFALIVAGAYYIAIHTKNNGSTVCGIDVNTEEGEQRILNSIKQMVGLCYEFKK